MREAGDTTEASIQYAYQELESKAIQYQAALESCESTLLIHQSLQRKQATDLLSNAEYLEGEAAYAQEQATKETASMSLAQTHESHCQKVKGVNWEPASSLVVYTSWEVSVRLGGQRPADEPTSVPRNP